ncbi:hypothetical protein AciX8_1074 [Granulicella mallensis MP5ACTX8]|uniref:Transmembrane protein n=2 Tax=Granulicella mallensis TaxID=940614 RepID=G8NW00_GRAMM|nr:hypothetical protein AciX8_1074 [Granulicella mallensis MP5ACTX8]
MLSPAARKYRKTSFMVLAGYLVLFPAASYVADRIHPTGAVLWMLAVLPVLPILGVMSLMGQYLRNEKDEYKRDLAVRCLLWGTAGMVIVNLFSTYLRIFGWNGQLFPFSEFFVFLGFMLVAKISYRMSNRVPADE